MYVCLLLLTGLAKYKMAIRHIDWSHSLTSVKSHEAVRLSEVITIGAIVTQCMTMKQDDGDYMG